MDPWTISLLLSIGLGIHNLGEGLGIGSASSINDLALAMLLSIGFAVHNITEGFAISSPLLAIRLARNLQDRGGIPIITPSELIKKLLILGLIAGGPTVIGAFILSSPSTNDLLMNVVMTSAVTAIIYSILNMNLSALVPTRYSPVL